MNEKVKTKGRVTLPAESGQEEVVKDLIKRWGVDALRDSDGTTLSDDILEMDIPIYSTICLVRAEQTWPREHPKDLPQLFLMTPRKTHTGGSLSFDLIADWAPDKYEVNEDDDPKEWWDVIDRTTGGFLKPEEWSYSNGVLTIEEPILYHEYTVNFLAYQTWDSTSMYNAITNGWEGDKVMCVDPYVPEVYDHLMDYFEKWLDEHPHTDVVRLTTLAFGFMLIRDHELRCVIRDWCGYCESVSPRAILDFEKKYGYRLRGEDFIQAGRYADTNLPPTKKMLDWMEFIEDFTIKYGRDLIDRIHKAGKKAAMFWGDHWIGAEPFSGRYKEMGFDILIGAAEDGNALRRVSDVPHDITYELRFYPYFFPDVFKDGASPEVESMLNWMKIRRALLRKPVDRIGWGGYLSLASKFPEFIDHTTDITNQFRKFHEKTNGAKPYAAPIRVGVLNAWGKLRSWMVQTGPIEKFYHGREDVMDFCGTNINECLAGLPVDVEFFSFSDILANPAALREFDVIINEGVMGSAWSGGDIWKHTRILEAVRAWTHNGGGFIGIGHPSACDCNGRIFQLSDILGVELELGQSIQISEALTEKTDSHFITEDLDGNFDVVNPHSYVFACDPETKVLNNRGLHPHLTAKSAGDGRSVYISSLPYNTENSRLLNRAIFWSASKEAEMRKWFSSNKHTDCACWPEKKLLALVNNTVDEQKTTVFDGEGAPMTELVLKPSEIRWIRL